MVKKLQVSIIVIFSLLCSIFLSTVAWGSEVDTLTKALNQVGIYDTGLIVEHLQKYKISKAERDKVIKEISDVQVKMQGKTHESQLSNANKVAIANSLIRAGKMLRMDVKFIDNYNREIKLTSYTQANGLKIKITDNKGKTLAYVDPKRGDFSKVSSSAVALKVFAESAYRFSNTFTPEVGGRLPDTATDYGNFILFGMSLVAIGGVSLLILHRRLVSNEMAS